MLEELLSFFDEVDDDDDDEAFELELELLDLIEDEELAEGLPELKMSNTLLVEALSLHAVKDNTIVAAAIALTILLIFIKFSSCF